MFRTECRRLDYSGSKLGDKYTLLTDEDEQVAAVTGEDGRCRAASCSGEGAGQGCQVAKAADKACRRLPPTEAAAPAKK